MPDMGMSYTSVLAEIDRYMSSNISIYRERSHWIKTDRIVSWPNILQRYAKEVHKKIERCHGFENIECGLSMRILEPKSADF